MIESVPADFDPDKYSSFGSFIPIYRDVKLAVFERLDNKDARVTLAVLDAISHHCDGWGMCFPLKISTIRKVAHIRWHSAVTGLSHMVDTLGWLKEFRTPLPRGRVDVQWQLSPFVIHVKPERIREALEMWQKALKISPQVFHPEHEPESKPERRNQKRSTRESTSEATREGHRTFREVDIEVCRVPLTDQRDEEFAILLTQELRTHLTVARQMILSYGRIETEQALKTVRSNPNARNPGGLFRTELRHRSQSTRSADRAAAGASGD